MFNEALQPQFAAMTVVGPDQNLWSTGDPQVDGAVISVGVRPLGPTGTYTVNYRVTSADGHVVSGSWSFRLTAAGTGTPGPSASETGSAGGGIPVWPFLVAAVAIVAAGALAVAVVLAVLIHRSNAQASEAAPRESAKPAYDPDMFEPAASNL